jgi:hypothetical protein
VAAFAGFCFGPTISRNRQCTASVLVAGQPIGWILCGWQIEEYRPFGGIRTRCRTIRIRGTPDSSTDSNLNSTYCVIDVARTPFVPIMQQDERLKLQGPRVTPLEFATLTLRDRYGKVNEHNGWVPRDFWLEDRTRCFRRECWPSESRAGSCSCGRDRRWSRPSPGLRA